MSSKLSAVLQDKGSTVQTIDPNTTIRRAVRTMNEHRIGCLLVTSGDQVLGVFTERDVLVRVVDQGKDPETLRVVDVMTTDVVSVPPTITVEEAMTVITEKRCRHLPVMDGQTVLGIVSIGDLTRWTVRNQAFHIQDLVSYITRKYPQ